MAIENKFDCHTIDEKKVFDLVYGNQKQIQLIHNYLTKKIQLL
jgi:hypothetical protein